MQIPISFSYDGKKFDGVFKAVSGGGSNSLFFLMINDFFFGQLFYTNQGWQFASNKNYFPDMAESFGHYIISWLDSSESESNPSVR